MLRAPATERAISSCQIHGCATSLTEEERYESRALHAERMDEIRNLIAACESAGMIAIYEGPTTSKFRDPTKQLPRHAHLTDYGCASERAVGRALREWGLSM